MGKNARNILNATACACVKHEGHTRRKALHKHAQKFAILVRQNYTDSGAMYFIFMAPRYIQIRKPATVLFNVKHFAGDAGFGELLIFV